MRRGALGPAIVGLPAQPPHISARGSAPQASTARRRVGDRLCSLEFRWPTARASARDSAIPAALAAGAAPLLVPVRESIGGGMVRRRLRRAITSRALAHLVGPLA